MFDKDGTLFGFQATFADWMDRLLDWGETQSGQARDRLASSIGYDVQSRRFTAGSIVVADTSDALGRIWQTEFGLPADTTATTADAIANDISPAPVTDLHHLLTHLRANGLKIGLATHDAEAPARQQLNRLGVIDLFDFIAGYDSGHGLKPGPGMIDAFSRKTGCPAPATIMVGDSIHDLGAGKAARCHSSIGVLTGPADAAHLQSHADVILDNIADLPEWLGIPLA